MIALILITLDNFHEDFIDLFVRQLSFDNALDVEAHVAEDFKESIHATGDRLDGGAFFADFVEDFRGHDDDVLGDET